uniref:Transthyretin-like family protein n=1 Tax=Bursaphelenchus xylophilus TaxID=6326 RepID=A0A1I7SIX1_BURXY
MNFYVLVIDDGMDQMVTNKTGIFQLHGHANELLIGNIDPQLKIYHECDDKFWCERMIRINIPQNYVYNGYRAKRFYDIGTIELSSRLGGFEKQERVCFH